MELGELVQGSASARFVVEQIASVDVTAEFSRDVLVGLSTRPKQLSPKYFYDEHGSWLYDKICQVPEYYPARTEEALLAEKSVEIVEATRPDTILELGSGTSRKTTHLLDACEALHCHAHYLPLDVCEEMLLDAGKRLVGSYDWLKVRALVGDYSEGFHNVPKDDGVRLYVFLGGTLGNLDEAEATKFLFRLRAMMDKKDYLLLGVDRVKNIEVLNAAYNDSQGYTAAFNRNVLSVINRELGGHFNPETFVHRAWFNEENPGSRCISIPPGPSVCVSMPWILRFRLSRMNPSTLKLAENSPCRRWSAWWRKADSQSQNTTNRQITTFRWYC